MSPGTSDKIREGDGGMITGAIDIEVLSGLNEGDQIVTGSFKVIRTLRNQARIKVDNTPAKPEG